MSERSKALAALKRLGSTRPEIMQMFATLDRFRFEKQEEPQAHRAMVLVLVSFIDILLEDAILTRFRVDLHQNASKRMFRGGQEQDAVLSTFNDKCLLAYAVDLISFDTLKDLDAIRSVRNICAHSMGIFDLNNDACDTLCRFNFIESWYQSGTTKPYPDSNQKKIATFAFYLINYLAMQHTYAPSFNSEGYFYWRSHF